MSRTFEYWNEKILPWDKSRYQGRWLTNRPIQKRLSLAASVLNKHISDGQTIVECGCGTGRLLPLLNRSISISYWGVDISPLAIDAAKQQPYGPKTAVHWVVKDVKDFSVPKSDWIVGLGFTDWVPFEEWRETIVAAQPSNLLFSFTLKGAPWYEAYRKWTDRKWPKIATHRFKKIEVECMLREMGFGQATTYHTGWGSPGKIWWARK